MIEFHTPDGDIKHEKLMIGRLIRFTKKYFRLFEFERKGWEFHIHFDAYPLDNDGKPEITSDFESSSAETKPQWEYQIAVIKFHIRAMIEKKRRGDEESYARHELIHVLVNEYTNLATALTNDLAEEKKSFGETLVHAEEHMVSMIEQLEFWEKLK